MRYLGIMTALMGLIGAGGGLGYPDALPISDPEPIPDPQHGEPGSNPEKRARKKAMKARKRRIQR